MPESVRPGLSEKKKDTRMHASRSTVYPWQSRSDPIQDTQLRATLFLNLLLSGTSLRAIDVNFSLQVLLPAHHGRNQQNKCVIRCWMCKTTLIEIFLKIFFELFISSRVSWALNNIPHRQFSWIGSIIARRDYGESHRMREEFNSSLWNAASTVTMFLILTTVQWINCTLRLA